jgi:hypothetical protein
MFRKLAPALVAPLLVAAACATEADDAAIDVRTGSAAVVALRAVPTTAAEAGSAAFEMVMAVSIEGETFELVSTGAYDTGAQRMSMEMDLGATLRRLAAAEDEGVPDGLDEPMQIVVDGTTVFLRAPFLEMLGGAGTWWSLSPEDLGVATDGLGLHAASFDPSRILESLRGVTGEPEVVGTEEVRGVETTRYTATLDLDKAVAEAPADQRDLVEAQLGQLGATRISVDVWVDADGLARRLEVDMSEVLGATGAGDDAGAVLAIELFDYGEPVDIQVPSPDQVTSLGDGLGFLVDSFASAS